jgi:FRG domain
MSPRGASGRRRKARAAARPIVGLSGYLEAVTRVVSDWTPAAADWYVQPWFRGHGDADWPLEPGWYRMPPPGGGIGAEFYSEATLLEEFKLRAPTYLERLPTTDWDWLFVMQHYGLPTRLLDWTEGALIALYFAVRDNPGDRDAAVWAMNPWWLNRRTFGDYTLFPADDPRADEHAPLKKEEALRGKLPLAITPSRATSRIVAQRGVFTIHGVERGALDRLARGGDDDPPHLRKLIVPSSAVDRLRQELSVAGISESLIFPELSGLCREIKSAFFGV